MNKKLRYLACVVAMIALSIILAHPSSVHAANAGKQIAATPASPANTVYGDCGDSFIYLSIDDILGVPYIDVDWGVDSSQGPIIMFNYHVFLYNNTWGTDSSFSGTAYPDGSSYSTFAEEEVGGGDIITQLSGTVTLANGSSCFLLSPSDEIWNS